MDTTKVKSWNEAKYRIVHWVLEKMREVPIGKLLADGGDGDGSRNLIS